jgi:chemotaxis protein MotA
LSFIFPRKVPDFNALEIESLMDSEIETHHHEEHAAVAALQRIAGGLSAFGIVAAVLGGA